MTLTPENLAAAAVEKAVDEALAEALAEVRHIESRNARDRAGESQARRVIAAAYWRGLVTHMAMMAEEQDAVWARSNAWLQMTREGSSAYRDEISNRDRRAARLRVIADSGMWVPWFERSRALP